MEERYKAERDRVREVDGERWRRDICGEIWGGIEIWEIWRRESW